MRKKRLIILCSILSVIAVLIVLASTVFMLSSVKVNFLESGMQVLSELDAQQIVKSGKFKYGSNILFSDFEKQMARIEKAHPFAKVHKVERKFPNKAIVHISERSPACHVKQNGNVYVLDSEFKVLLVVYQENFNSGNTQIPSNALNTPQLVGVTLSEGISSGDFEDNAVAMAIIKSIQNSLEKISHSILDLSKIDISQDKNNQLMLNLHVGENQLTLQVVGDTSLQTKLTNGFFTYFNHLKENGDTAGKIHVSDSNINSPTYINN